MKEVNTAAGYALVYHGLAEIARRHGWALSLHGSMLTDLDIVAIPWTEEAKPAMELLGHLKKHLGCLDLLGKDYEFISGPEQKPHGRIAWKINLSPAGSVDISIMPRTHDYIV